MRGLKHTEHNDPTVLLKSHLLQMRGLKLINLKNPTRKKMSHLLQMRGLKPMTKYSLMHPTLVASFTDAWIETKANAITTSYVWVASFTDAWIETMKSATLVLSGKVASFTDAWIETSMSKEDVKKWSRIFYRCVD